APVLPSEAQILAGRLADQRDAFGSALSDVPESPQGQLRQSEAAIIGDKNAAVAYVANMLDPDYSEGVWQDSVAKLHMLTRKQGGGTVVPVQCYGAPGTVITAGSKVQDVNRLLYSAVADTVIGSGGVVDVQFQADAIGPIPCAAGSITRIYTAIPGWDSVANEDAGALGEYVESRYAFEERRRESIAIGSSASPVAKLAAVRALSGVIDAFVAENDTGSPLSFGFTGYTLPPHSVCFSVAGGDDVEIASTLWQKKNPGCKFVGNVSMIVEDDVNFSSPPLPTYEIRWLTPSAANVFFRVRIRQNRLLPSDINAKIKAAIVAAFSGSDGGERARIGRKVSAGRYYPGVVAIDKNLDVLQITLGLGSSTSTASSVEFGIDQLPTLSESNITIVVES
ncbi:MAG: baseplate J/gp47 family protein, partial [Betaproteobacteria bacterium]